jgi:CheY-like chemotaxis protein
MQAREMESRHGYCSDVAMGAEWISLEAIGEMTRSILIVEDDRDIADVFTELLAGEGYRVATVYDGEQAFAHVTSHLVDLIVSDVRMPRMDGITLTTSIRALGKAIPIILISAIEFQDEARRLPNVTFLRKPVSIDTLIDTVAAELSKQPSA